MEHNVDHSLLYSLLRFLFGTLLWKQFCSKGIAHIRWRILPNSPFVLNGIVPWYLLECFSSDFQDIWPICLKILWLFLRLLIIPKFNFSFSWKFAQEKPEIEYTLLKLHHLLVNFYSWHCKEQPWKYDIVSFPHYNINSSESFSFSIGSNLT